MSKSHNRQQQTQASKRSSSNSVIAVIAFKIYHRHRRIQALPSPSSSAIIAVIFKLCRCLQASPSSEIAQLSSLETVLRTHQNEEESDTGNFQARSKETLEALARSEAEYKKPKTNTQTQKIKPENQIPKPKKWNQKKKKNIQWAEFDSMSWVWLGFSRFVCLFDSMSRVGLVVWFCCWLFEINWVLFEFLGFWVF